MRYTFLAIMLLLGCSQPECPDGTLPDGTCIIPEEPHTLPPILPDQGSEGAAQNVTADDNEFGYLARPREQGVYPGIIMIHEWWGLNDNIKQMARTLAAEGYIVQAVDLFNGEVATEPERARQLVTGIDQERANERMKGAVRYLKAQGADRVASLGWCFGGGQSLQLSSATDLDATVVYYGNIPDNLSNISGPVLGIFGELDETIPAQEVERFRQELDRLNVSNQIYIYPGVGHAFANPSGDNYAKEETEDAWSKTLAFLNSELGQAEKQLEARSIRMHARNYRFYMDGDESPTIRVAYGQAIALEISSYEGEHDIRVDEIGLASNVVNEGDITTVNITPMRKGEFQYYCSVGNHRHLGMSGRFIVE
jgi:carboxymethylenebutenolidase